jgi:hypothetical protein
MAQAGHAAVWAGSRFGPPEHCRLVVLGVPSQAPLLDAVGRAEAAGVRCALFFEPDEGVGYSAACTEPVSGAARRLFRRYIAWAAPKDSGEIRWARGPPDVGQPRCAYFSTGQADTTDQESIYLNLFHQFHPLTRSL